MGSLSEQHLVKLNAALTMPLPKNGDQLVTLRLGDDSKMEVRKGLLAMASTVLSEALQLDLGCTELKVEGTADIWQRLMALVLRTREQQLQPSDVEALLPIAHKYNMQGVLELLKSCVQGFTYTIDANHPLYVMKWLSLATKYQIPWVASPCAKFILSQMGEVIYNLAYVPASAPSIQAFLKQFSPVNAASIDAPADIIITLTMAFEALQYRMRV